MAGRKGVWNVRLPASFNLNLMFCKIVLALHCYCYYYSEIRQSEQTNSWFLFFFPTRFLFLSSLFPVKKASAFNTKCHEKREIRNFPVFSRSFSLLPRESAWIYIQRKKGSHPILLIQERSHRYTRISNPARHLLQFRCQGLFRPQSVLCPAPAYTSSKLLIQHQRS